MRNAGARAADLQRESQAHRQALQDFVATAETIDLAGWSARRGGDRWSPAQIAEHLRLSYVVVRAEIAGQPGFRARTRWWQQRFLRFLYLRRILKRGRFPQGAPAVREIRPGAGPFVRSDLLRTLGDECEQFLQAVAAAPEESGAAITHPFLGSLNLVDGVRFMTQHIRHHHSQIVSSPR